MNKYNEELKEVREDPWCAAWAASTPWSEELEYQIDRVLEVVE